MSVISQSMIEALSKQYHHEVANSLRYYQRAIFADVSGLTGIAKFFKSQAEDERGHADKIMAYAIDRNVILTLSGFHFGDPDINPGTSIVTAFETAKQVELETSAMLEDILALARSENDYMTEQWLLDKDGLIREQIEEEALYQTILDRVDRMIGSASLVHDLDIWIGSL